MVCEGNAVKELECADMVELATNAFENASIRERILYLESAMKKSQSCIDIEPMHYFSKGLYAREITIPKGTLLTGKIHKTEHLNIISKGDISVLTEDGPKRIQAPFTMVSQPGTKRVGYAHEETVWTTIHATEETDLVQLEADLIATDFHDTDYADMLDELHASHAWVRTMTERTHDQTAMPDGDYKFTIGSSDIEGKGVIATNPIVAGETVGPARIGVYRTPLGRYTNHAKYPNAEMVAHGEDIDLVMLKSAQIGEEITVDYRQSKTTSRGMEGDKLCLG